MWKCDFKGCGRTSVRSDGECIICDRHLCVEHMDHECPRLDVSKTVHIDRKYDLANDQNKGWGAI
jgi:hypothetical protein